MTKMNGRVIFPTSNEELAVIRNYPQKAVDVPRLSQQKVGIIVYSFLILFLLVMFFWGTFVYEFGWSFYLLLFLPLSHSYNLFNMFAVVEGGLLSGSRFIPWRRLQYYQFVPIDVNHKFYGYSKEVNDGYELKISTIGFPISCIVTSNDMKEKLTKILGEHVKDA